MEVVAVAATHEALCGELDLALSWSERELPERERTKHVHRLHPLPLGSACRELTPRTGSTRSGPSTRFSGRPRH
ncbi:MAG: hypothetical protein ACYC1P_00525 [Gaiellaceae bacterium]